MFDGDTRVRFLHTMVRVSDVEASLHFYCTLLGLEETRRIDVPEGKFTLIFLAAPREAKQASEHHSPEIELTYNWEGEEVYDTGRSWGHLAFMVEDIYATCARLEAAGVVINRPPRDGRMAFVKSPDNVSIELLQEGEALPIAEPWASRESIGTW